MTGNREAWESEAQNWLRWARTPGHDAYWYYRTSFFDSIVPPPRGVTLEVGCGEGRVVRDLVARGHQVIAIDGSPTLLRHAAEADLVGRYALADALALPIGDSRVDLAVAYNSLMDFDDLPAAVQQVSRVLKPGSDFCVCVVHPLFDAGGFADDSEDSPYVLRGCYFSTQQFDETFEEEGTTMRFRGWSHSLEEYFGALSGAGFAVESLREPLPEEGEAGYSRRRRYPMFLHLRAVKTRR